MTQHPRRWAWLPALLAVTALFAASCSSDSSGSAEGGDKAATEKVVLITYDSFALPEEAAAAFKEQTGAKIEVVASGDSGGMLTKALLSAGSPEGDVIFGIDNTMASRALGEDLLAPVAGPVSEKAPEQYRLGGEADQKLAPIDTGDVCINYDTKWFADNAVTPPATLDDLLKPEYKDLTVVESPVTSSPGMALLIGTIARYGEDGWQTYWKALGDNGLSVRPSWDDAYYTDYTVSGGDRPIVLSYASSPPVEVFFSEGELTEPRSAVALETCTAQIEYAGVLKGAANPELAEQLLEFMLSEDWQKELPLTNFVFPVVDVELPEVFAKFAQRAEDPASLPPEQIEADSDTWIEQWRELME